MRLLVGFLVAVLFVVLFHTALKRVPGVFYAVAALVVVVYLYGVVVGLPAWIWKSVLFLMQKNVLAFALFAIVMFAGVLPHETRLKKALMSVRRELSIVACILSLGHVLVFGRQYLTALVEQTAPMNITYLAALLVALCCACLMVPLGTTSLNAVHRRMSPQAWKRLQLLAYPFFLLAGAHAALFLGSAAAAGSREALSNAAAYGILLLTYIILRTAKAIRSSRSSRDRVGDAGEA